MIRHCCVTALVVLTICLHENSGFFLDCASVCSALVGNDTTTEIYSGTCACGFPYDIHQKITKTETLHLNKTDTTSPPTTLSTTTTITTSTTTTQSMCDYLCSIQEGGAACDCSKSIVPGR
ncbi:uncharacterized protein LOC128235865 [Mya arenaria]|uniref:uncharacterized protein LOC128235865 n=1 Tax=Mya arenaria TaxID=6604 RepID=UPI0022DF4CC4|nr:uncharacterized protein LOC128235865 [Mya arenaria]